MLASVVIRRALIALAVVLVTGAAGDALGLPAMAGEAVTVRASCHHCGEALSLRVGPEGPADSHDVMVWVGERGDLRGKASDAL